MNKFLEVIESERAGDRETAKILGSLERFPFDVGLRGCAPLLWFVRPQQARTGSSVQYEKPEMREHYYIS